MVCAHAEPTFVSIGAFPLVRSFKDARGAVLAGRPLVAERDGTTAGTHFPGPFALLCNFAKFDVLPVTTRLVISSAGQVGACVVRLTVFPPLCFKENQEGGPMLCHESFLYSLQGSDQ